MKMFACVLVEAFLLYLVVVVDSVFSLPFVAQQNCMQTQNGQQIEVKCIYENKKIKNQTTQIIINRNKSEIIFLLNYAFSKGPSISLCVRAGSGLATLFFLLLFALLFFVLHYLWSPRPLHGPSYKRDMPSSPLILVLLHFHFHNSKFLHKFIPFRLESIFTSYRCAAQQKNIGTAE